MFTLNDFPLRLAQLRAHKDVSAHQMSLDLGMNSGYIQNIESGKAFPSMTAFFDICEYLQISPSEFFDLEDKDPARTKALLADLMQLNDTQWNTVQAVIDGLLKK